MDAILDSKILFKNFNSIGSTNTELKKDFLSKTTLDLKDIKNKLVVYNAEHQSQGKGRGIDKYWDSPYGENLYVSVGWVLPVNQLKNISTLSIKISQVIISLLEDYEISNIQFKWPNDVLVNGKKISGVLIEIVKISEVLYGVICGIGLNINMGIVKDLNNTSMKIELNQVALDKDKVLSNLLNKIMNFYIRDDYSIDFTKLKEYNILNYNKAIDKSIQLIINGQKVVAKYIDITNLGALKVSIDNEIKKIYSVDKLIL